MGPVQNGRAQRRTDAQWGKQMPPEVMGLFMGKFMELAVRCGAQPKSLLAPSRGIMIQGADGKAYDLGECVDLVIGRLFSEPDPEVTLDA